MALIKVIFLDRDGTINVDSKIGHVAEVAEWQFAPRAIEGLALLKNAGYTLALITNQTGIGAGLYTLAQMRAVHAYMQEELDKHGVALDAIAFCPHNPDDLCGCRKPEPGMAKHIEEQVGAIDYANSWMVGDRIADLQFGNNIGVHTALIKSPYWQNTELPTDPDFVVSSLLEAATRITGQ